MKQLAIFFFLCFVAVTLASPLEANPTAARESQQKLKDAHTKCQSDPSTAVDESALRALRTGGPKPANYGPHSLCISQTLGWQNADGSVNSANIRSRAEHIFGSSTKLNEIVSECAQNQANAEETAVHLTRCYAKYAPRPRGVPPGHH